MVEHLAIFRALFVRVRQAGLTIKPTKCYLGYGCLDFVGHQIGQDEVKTQEDRVDHIRNAPIPTTKKQVRSFLGTADCYRKFVNGYSKIAAPLTDLTRAKQYNKMSWSEETNNLFNQLKQALCNAHILKLPDMNKPFILRTDASGTGLGAMLLQEGNATLFPIAFTSKKLSLAQRRYSVAEIKYLGIVWGLQKFNLYLYGQSFVAQCDQRPLKCLKTVKLTKASKKWRDPT